MLSNYIDSERLIHSTKTAIACLLGLAFAHFIGMMGAQWTIITIIVVMCAQIYVGSVIQRAYLRLLGTLAGSFVAAFALLTFGDGSLVITITVCFASFVFSYIATARENLTYAGTLGAVTTTIIMIGQSPTLHFAAMRFLEISIGILIATLVSQFVLPIHARSHIRRSQAATLSQIKDYYMASIVKQAVDIQPQVYQELDESIVKSLSKQRQLAKEALREPLGIAYDQAGFVQTLQCEREVLRAIHFMHTALEGITSQQAALTHVLSGHDFNKQILEAFDALIKVIAEEDLTQHMTVPYIATLRASLGSIIHTSSAKELIYIDGFLFSAGVLAASLVKLANLYHVPLSGNALLDTTLVPT